MNKHGIDRLLVKISNGDNEAFAELYEQTKKGVFSFIYTYLQDYHQSEDAMQDVYLKIKRGIHHYRHGTNGVAWILQIAKFHALDILRAQRPTEPIENCPDEGTCFDDGSMTDLLVRTLTPEEAQIVTLHAVWQFKHREIAEMNGIPVGTVTSKYKRAIEKLRHALSK